jgi:hypothetical protein
MKFPAGIYDQPKALLQSLGNFWADIYDRRDQISSYVRAKAGVETQSMLDLLATIAALSRYTVPLFHKDNWFELTLLESQRNGPQTGLIRYGDTGIVYDGIYSYDVPVDSDKHAFPLPNSLVDAPLILDRFISPTLSWAKNVDFTIDSPRGSLTFRINPFTDPRVLVRPVYKDGAIIDREAVLWIFRGDFDFETIYQQFGYVLGLRLKSSEGYRQLMNAIFDAIVGGTARRQLELAFVAMTGIPLVQEATETVQAIDLDKSNRLIITDRHVYKFDSEVTPTVEIGDTVHRGDSLVDALQFFEFNRGQLDDQLKALALGPGLLASCYYGELIFENKDFPLEVITNDPSGFTKVKFPLGGFPLDVERFFDDLHANGVLAAAKPIEDCVETPKLRIPGDGCDTEDVFYRQGTLAHMLDLREVRDSEPTASALPTTINPLKFLVENVLRGNVFVVQVKNRYLGSGQVGLHNSRLLRKIVPPHTALIVIVELTPAADSVTTDAISETIGTFDALELRTDEVTNGVREHRPQLRLISGACQ